MPGGTSRTFHLDRELALGLGDATLEHDDGRFADFLDDLPDALTKEEVDDVGLNVRIFQDLGYRDRMRLEADALFKLGSHAVHSRGDLVTAQNVAKSLVRKASVAGVVGSSLLRWEIRKARKRIIAEIVDADSAQFTKQ